MERNDQELHGKKPEGGAAPDENRGPITDPPRGNSADPTASVADPNAVNPRSVTPKERDKVPDLEEFHTVGMPDQERKGALGKTDPNLGQDTPLGGADAEGRKKDVA